MADQPTTTRALPSREEQIKLMEEAPQRMEAATRQWLDDPAVKAMLHEADRTAHAMPCSACRRLPSGWFACDRQAGCAAIQQEVVNA